MKGEVYFSAEYRESTALHNVVYVTLYNLLQEVVKDGAGRKMDREGGWWMHLRAGSAPIIKTKSFSATITKLFRRQIRS